MGELRDEAQKVLERCPGDAHGNMISAQDDAVLVVVAVRGVLEIPVLAMKVERDKPQVLSCGMPLVAEEALVLPAEQTLWVAGRGDGPGTGDIPRVLLRLGEVDGDVQLAELRGGLPADVTGRARGADVVRGDAQLVKPVCGLLRRGGL